MNQDFDDFDILSREIKRIVSRNRAAVATILLSENQIKSIDDYRYHLGQIIAYDKVDSIIQEVYTMMTNKLEKLREDDDK